MSGKYNRKDHLYNRAKSEGYRSRAAYKLQELQKKYRIFHLSDSVLDLGCFPGGWSQVASEFIGPKGIVLGVDLKAVEPLTSAVNQSPVHFVMADIFDPATFDFTSLPSDWSQALAAKFNVFISDLSPSLSGVKDRDIAQSVELVAKVFALAKTLLKPQGTVVAKIFPAPETDELIKELKGNFSQITRAHLKATRDTSSEFYIVAQKYLARN
ncbi:RlmE family RNA methyltransferase [bacterium]|nr:RlmE family RNA methyltransferase [bacterium]